MEMEAGGVAKTAVDMAAARGGGGAAEGGGGGGGGAPGSIEGSQDGSDSTLPTAGISDTSSSLGGGSYIVDGDDGSRTAEDQQQQEKSDASGLSLPRDQLVGGGGNSGHSSSWSSYCRDIWGGGTVKAPRGEGPSDGTPLGKVVGVPRQAQARAVHLLYDHCTFIRELEVMWKGTRAETLLLVLCLN